MRWTQICPYALLLLLAAPASAQQVEPLVLMTVDYPPYEIETPVEGLEGHDVEVIKAAFALMKQPVDICFAPWKRAVLLAREGKVGGIFSCVYSKEREDFIALSDPISSITPTIITPSGYAETEIRQLADVTALRAVGLRGYAYTDRLTDLGMEPHLLTTDEQALKYVAMDRADVFFTTRENARFVARQLGLSDRLKFHGLEGEDITLFRLCFSRLQFGYKNLVAGFNEALAQLRANGTYQKIHQRYQ